MQKHQFLLSCFILDWLFMLQKIYHYFQFQFLQLFFILQQVYHLFLKLLTLVQFQPMRPLYFLQKFQVQSFLFFNMLIFNFFLLAIFCHLPKLFLLFLQLMLLVPLQLLVSLLLLEFQQLLELHLLFQFLLLYFLQLVWFLQQHFLQLLFYLQQMEFLQIQFCHLLLIQLPQQVVVLRCHLSFQHWNFHQLLERQFMLHQQHRLQA